MDKQMDLLRRMAEALELEAMRNSVRHENDPEGSNYYYKLEIEQRKLIAEYNEMVVIEQDKSVNLNQYHRDILSSIKRYADTCEHRLEDLLFVKLYRGTLINMCKVCNEREFNRELEYMIDTKLIGQQGSQFVCLMPAGFEAINQIF